MEPLFFIGNKRSGTSHLVRLLNLHPEIAVTHESDAVWILYCHAHGLEPRRYEWDGPRGMAATLATAADVIDDFRASLARGERVPEAYREIQLRVLRRGLAVQEPVTRRWDDLRWLGEKKPVQQADPRLLDFTRLHFPAARYVHIVRHPSAVIASMQQQARARPTTPFWAGSPPDLLHRWILHEEWALQAATAVPVHRLRYEDLLADPPAQLAELLAFLGLAMTDEIAASAAEQTRAPARTDLSKTDLDLASARPLLQTYGYQVSSSRWRPTRSTAGRRGTTTWRRPSWLWRPR